MGHPARGIPFNLDHEIQLWQRHIATEAMECQDLLKSQLARLLGDRNPHLYQQDADRIVDIVLDEITAALKDGGRVDSAGSDRSRSGHVMPAWAATLAAARLSRSQQSSHLPSGVARTCTGASTNRKSDAVMSGRQHIFHAVRHVPLLADQCSLAVFAEPRIT